MKAKAILHGVLVSSALATLTVLGTVAEAGKMKGSVRVDGSSTVFPITEAVAEEFRGVQPKVRVSVGFSGTGGGFKKFYAGETHINDASRPIKGKEIAKCQEAGIEFIELPVAYDGLSVVVSRKNEFVDHLTVEELHAIWKPESEITMWSQVRAGWPQEKIVLYGPGTDSGTFDYFTEAINGKSQACRADFTASEDDNVLVQGVAGDPNALGFFGFAYYIENDEKIRAVPVDPGTGPVSPTTETINDGTYAPLSRPIFIYVARPAADLPEVEAFVHFYLESAPALVSEVGYVPLPRRGLRPGPPAFRAPGDGNRLRPGGLLARGALSAAGQPYVISTDVETVGGGLASSSLRRSRSRPGEAAIRIALLGCALVSILTTVGIIIVLGRESLSFFGQVSPWEFLFGTRWTPLLEPRSFGCFRSSRGRSSSSWGPRSSPFPRDSARRSISASTPPRGCGAS